MSEIKPLIFIYNTATKKKELFVPINHPNVGIYSCGPTVYSDAHIGHARKEISVDVLVRYLKQRNFKVRYVRNITDVGHLERDSDDGEDKIAKQSKLESLEPMEVVQNYTINWRRDMALLNNLIPSIEPLASGHIIEQIEAIKKIIANGTAYEINGSVYFDVRKYSKNFNYGELSGRVIDDQIEQSRTLKGQSEKQFFADFALWKRATEKHLMAWPSPWGHGFPGWHIECTAMSQKYLGDYFDIHAGGIDLMFPHHECEIAQCKSITNLDPVKYWFHNNMITIDGQKMGKSLGNFVTLNQLFSGEHPSLDKSYDPMVLRFLVLQSHYRSTLSFSLEALQSSEVGYKKLLSGIRILKKLQQNKCEAISRGETDLVSTLNRYYEDCHIAMSDDFNTAKVVAILFEVLSIINKAFCDREYLNAIGTNGLQILSTIFETFFTHVLGLLSNSPIEKSKDYLEVILNLYDKAKLTKDYKTVDELRNSLKNLGIKINDSKYGITLTDL